jgi:hypothetical protein
MSAKVSIFKSTMDGEQVNIEFNIDKKEFETMKQRGTRFRSYLDPFFRLADDRLLEMNLRIMITQRAVKALSPDVQVAWHQLMGVLHGQQPSDPMYRSILQEAIQEVTEKLLAQGVPGDQVRNAVESTYGPISDDNGQKLVNIQKEESNGQSNNR